MEELKDIIQGLISKCLKGSNLECELGIEEELVYGESKQGGSTYFALKQKDYGSLGYIQVNHTSYSNEEMSSFIAHGSDEKVRDLPGFIKLSEESGIMIEGVKVKSLTHLPMTLGEDYRKQLEHDLQTLIKVEFGGTQVECEANNKKIREPSLEEQKDMLNA